MSFLKHPTIPQHIITILVVAAAAQTLFMAQAFADDQ